MNIQADIQILHKTRVMQSQTRSVRQQAHLVPGDVRLFARFNIVVYVGTKDVFALAEFSLLGSSHVGVVAQVRVILCHSQGHGHLHAVRRVPVSGEQHKEFEIHLFSSES